MSMVVVCGRPRPWPVSNGTGGGGGDLVPDFTAASGSTADVQDMLDDITAAGAGKIGLIPAGTWSWTTGITWTAPNNTIIIGAGSLSAIGGGDTTVIVDNYVSSNILLRINVAATGTFRLAGLTVLGTAESANKQNGVVYIDGPGTARVDHVHLDGAAAEVTTKIAWFGNGVYGVLHHSIIDLYGNGGLYCTNGSGADGHGDASWAAATGLGTASFLFVEDNLCRGTVDWPTRIADCYSGGRMVWRFNTFEGMSGLELHDTGHSPDDRGARAQEGYGNHFTPISGAVPSFCVADCSSGPAMIWGNEVDAETLKSFAVLKVVRKNDDTYRQPPNPTGWGFAGSTPRSSGTVNVAANGVDVTKASGDNFNTAWPAGTMITIAGASCNNGGEPGVGASCRIASVGSTTALTLTNSAGGALTGAAYNVGSNWDGNTDVLGYPALDQPGRGEGDLLVGEHPTKTNQTTGTIAWPNQALEPIYFWKNVCTPATGYGGEFYAEHSLGRVVANQDYYPQASGIQTNATTPFNGTVGCGWGTIANRPTTCTVGVGYWATDEGTWNESASNPEGVNQAGASGQLYVCEVEDEWTLYYTPYTYPHPLNT